MWQDAVKMGGGGKMKKYWAPIIIFSSLLFLMGMGEPLLNYEHMMNAVEIITAGIGLAARRAVTRTGAPGW